MPDLKHPDLKHYELDTDGDVLIIVARTSLSGGNDPDLTTDRHQIEAHIAEGGITSVVFDFRRVTHFSSSVINTLTQSWNQLKASGGKLAVCSLTPLAREALTVARVDSVLHLFSTQAEAVAHVRQ